MSTLKPVQSTTINSMNPAPSRVQSQEASAKAQPKKAVAPSEKFSLGAKAAGGAIKFVFSSFSPESLVKTGVVALTAAGVLAIVFEHASIAALLGTTAHVWLPAVIGIGVGIALTVAAIYSYQGVKYLIQKNKDNKAAKVAEAAVKEAKQGEAQLAQGQALARAKEAQVQLKQAETKLQQAEAKLQQAEAKLQQAQPVKEDPLVVG